MSDIDPKLYKFYAARNLDELMGYKRCQTSGMVKEFLGEFDDELPYESYEVFYDWGWDGYKDGFDVVCFYENGPGYLHENYKDCMTYNEDYLPEITPAAKDEYKKHLESRSEENRLRRMADNNADTLRKIKNKSNARKIRNLSICPLTPDPPEVLDLIAELKAYLKTVEWEFIGTYKASFTFDYDGVTYMMDSYALSAAPDQLLAAKDHICERLEQFGASNCYYSDRWD